MGVPMTGSNDPEHPDPAPDTAALHNTHITQEELDSAHRHEINSAITFLTNSIFARNADAMTAFINIFFDDPTCTRIDYRRTHPSLTLHPWQPGLHLRIWRVDRPSTGVTARAVLMENVISE